MIGLMACPLCPTLESQKARRYCYPLSWLGLKTPKSLAHGCLGKGTCKVQVPDPNWGARPHPHGGKSPCVAAPARRHLPAPKLRPYIGAHGELDLVPLRINVGAPWCVCDYIFLSFFPPSLPPSIPSFMTVFFYCRTAPALFMGSCLTFYF